MKTALIHSDEYARWIFDASHPTQGRRFIKAQEKFTQLMHNKGAAFDQFAPRHVTRQELERVHSSEYISEVIDHHKSSQWAGIRPDLSELASLFAGGTLSALDLLLHHNYALAIHFPGAKHHAQYDRSSGFCIFADIALAADIATKQFEKKVAILDFDAHHGDGTENLTADNPSVLTFSIHEKGIFPGTGNESNSEKNIYNYPLGNLEIGGERGKGDQALLRGVREFLERAHEFNPEILFIAAGADGHAEDPLSSLQFSINGYKSVARSIREAFPNTPILIGGAGGYLPDTRTPEVWSEFATALVTVN